MQINALGSLIGSEVCGVDLSAPLSAELRCAIYDLWVERAVLVFRDQQLDGPQFLRAAENFGPILRQQLSRFSLPGCPAVGTISSRDLPIVDGELHVRGENFHTDHSNFNIPPKATLLHAIELPSRGGDTQFVDVRAAYDDLAEELKFEIRNLKSLHVYESSDSPRKMAVLTAAERAQVPTSPQPLVISHEDSGRPALYLNTGRMEGIQGMEAVDARSLIDRLFKHATQAKYEYRHIWKPGDFVIWDNRSVMHQANADFDPTEYRYLIRVMIEGAALRSHSVSGK
jgi:taurine dioxygenase